MLGVLSEPFSISIFGPNIRSVSTSLERLRSLIVDSTQTAKTTLAMALASSSLQTPRASSFCYSLLQNLSNSIALSGSSYGSLLFYRLYRRSSRKVRCLQNTDFSQLILLFLNNARNWLSSTVLFERLMLLMLPRV